MVDCPPCNCADTPEVVALKQKAADMKAAVLVRQNELLATIDSLTSELAALQQKNIEYLRPRADLCSVSSSPQAIYPVQGIPFGGKCR